MEVIVQLAFQMVSFVFNMLFYFTSALHFIWLYIFFVSVRVCKADFRNSFQNWTASDSITFPEGTQDTSGRAEFRILCEMVSALQGLAYFSGVYPSLYSESY